MNRARHVFTQNDDFFTMTIYIETSCHCVNLFSFAQTFTQQWLFSQLFTVLKSFESSESANFIEKLGLRICHLCQLRYNSWLSEKTFGFLIAFVTMFPICFYMPRFFEMRSKEDIKVIFTGSKALEILLGCI